MNSLINSWKSCYQTNLANKSSAIERLRALKTWDTPQPNESKRAFNEHLAKKEALTQLISESWN